MSSKTLFVLSVGTGSGRESTEGGGDIWGEVGLELGFLVNLLAAAFFLSLLKAPGNDTWKSVDRSPRGGAGEWGRSAVGCVNAGTLDSSFAGNEPGDEKDPTR